jgi:serine/threonine protein kinase
MASASNRITPQAPERPSGASDLAPGCRLGSYELLQRLGSGGMGELFRARHLHLKKELALKVLSSRLTNDTEAALRFQRETEALGRLEHGHLVRATDAGVIDGVPFVVMELLDGMDLAKLTVQRGPWPVAEACAAMRQAALGLQHAHERGLVHRDIKPSNLLLTTAGVIKVLDLGLARLCMESTSGSLTRPGSTMGTPDYIAPEQILDSHASDIRADLYSLGCSLFHLLTGEPVFGKLTHPTIARKHAAHLNEPPPDIRLRRPDVPPELAAVLARLLAKRPEDRYATPADVAAALEPFAAGARLASILQRTDAPPLNGVATHPPQTTLATGGMAPGARRRRRPGRRYLLTLAGALLLGGLVLAAGPWLRRSPQSEGPSPPSEPLRIKEIYIRSFRPLRGGKFREAFLLGEPEGRLPQGYKIKLHASLSRPGHFYLIALLPSGKTELCLPSGEDQVPPLLEKVDYSPTGPLDRPGLYGYVLVASPQALPTYKDWQKEHGSLPWRASQTESAWRWWGGDRAGDIEESPAWELQMFLRKLPETTGFVVFPVVEIN